ncbi:MAG TPA: hypothetical protein VLK36_00935 [Gaiellaceae bacterium]|nr:hypothetical protein [Gaiellaceae bacterium]
MTRLRYLPLLLPLAALAGCGGSGSTPAAPTIAPARTYELVDWKPVRVAKANVPTEVSFVIQQPDGKPLTAFKRGPGPHTGVHLIFVRDDLGYIVHRHPPIAADGTIHDRIAFPAPGTYRAVIDVYPRNGSQPNFQLFHRLRVAGTYEPRPLPAPSRTVTVDGYRFTLDGSPKLRAIEPAFLKLTVTDPQGRPASFSPWFGALAHAIFFRSGSLDYFHTHVCAPGANGCTSALGGTRVTGTSSTPGKLSVGVLVPVAGKWRLFLQTRIRNRVLTAPFTLNVR